MSKTLMNKFIVFIFGIILMSSQTIFASSKLKIVKTENVCMITNAVFPNKQIPVVVGDKTYYGCCENCKLTLANDAKSRFAKDPVTGKIIDKAEAVIAANTDGSVIYFESNSTFKKYTENNAK